MSQFPNRIIIKIPSPQTMIRAFSLNFRRWHKRHRSFAVQLIGQQRHKEHVSNDTGNSPDAISTAEERRNRVTVVLARFELGVSHITRIGQNFERNGEHFVHLVRIDAELGGIEVVDESNHWHYLDPVARLKVTGFTPNLGISIQLCSKHIQANNDKPNPHRFVQAEGHTPLPPHAKHTPYRIRLSRLGCLRETRPRCCVYSSWLIARCTAD